MVLEFCSSKVFLSLPAVLIVLVPNVFVGSRVFELDGDDVSLWCELPFDLQFSSGGSDGSHSSDEEIGDE